MPLMKHQRLALGWMVARETRGCLPMGGMLADDQVCRGVGMRAARVAHMLYGLQGESWRHCLVRNPSVPPGRPVQSLQVAVRWLLAGPGGRALTSESLEGAFTLPSPHAKSSQGVGKTLTTIALIIAARPSQSARQAGARLGDEGAGRRGSGGDGGATGPSGPRIKEDAGDGAEAAGRRQGKESMCLDLTAGACGKAEAAATPVEREPLPAGCLAQPSPSEVIEVDLLDDSDGAGPSAQPPAVARRRKTVLWTPEKGEAGAATEVLHGGTLVVCPTSVLHQWAAEIKSKTTPEAGLTVHIYHGPGTELAQAFPSWGRVVVPRCILIRVCLTNIQGGAWHAAQTPRGLARGAWSLIAHARLLLQARTTAVPSPLLTVFKRRQAHPASGAGGRQRSAHDLPWHDAREPDPLPGGGAPGREAGPGRRCGGGDGGEAARGKPVCHPLAQARAG